MGISARTSVLVDSELPWDWVWISLGESTGIEVGKETESEDRRLLTWNIENWARRISKYR